MAVQGMVPPLRVFVCLCGGGSCLCAAGRRGGAASGGAELEESGGDLKHKSCFLAEARERVVEIFISLPSPP